MSIQSEINRLIQAKKNIISAITSKGVTVPADASMDDLTALVQAIETDSNPILQEKTVSPTTSQQTVTPDATYDGLSKVTVNAMPTATQATPSISVSSAGLITASATQTAGYVSAGTKSATKQLTTQAAQTITPGTSNKTIASGRYLTGAQTIKGDSNLKAENIKSGVSIFGVAGSYEGSGGGVTNETCEVTVRGSGGSSYYPTNVAYTSVDESGKVIGVNQSVSTSSVTITCIKGSTLAVKFKSTLGTSIHINNASFLFSAGTTATYKLDDNATTAYIPNDANAGGGGGNN